MSKSLSVLIIDDEPTNFHNKMTLENYGWVDSISIKKTGKEAMRYFCSALR